MNWHNLICNDGTVDVSSTKMVALLAAGIASYKFASSNPASDIWMIYLGALFLHNLAAKGISAWSDSKGNGNGTNQP